MLGREQRERLALACTIIAGWWPAVVQLLAIPFYLRLLGVERYAAIGLFSTLVVLARVFDFGLHVVVSRDAARAIADGTHIDRFIDLFVAIETVYQAIAACLVLALLLSGQLTELMHLGAITRTEHLVTVALFSLTFGVTWISQLYQHALLGIGLQKFMAGTTVAAYTAAAALSIVALGAFQSSLAVLFACHLLVWTVYVIALRWRVYHELRRLLPNHLLAPSFSLLGERLHFTASTALFLTLALLVANIDRIILTLAVPSRELGLYLLAATVAAGITTATGPIFSYALPHLTRSAGDSFAYFELSAVTLAILAPITASLCIMPEDFLHLWTGSADVARGAGTVTSILVVGTAALALTLVPSALQLAVGDTRTMNVAASLTVVGMLLAVSCGLQWGGLPGAATGWSTCCVLYAFVRLATAGSQSRSRTSGAISVGRLCVVALATFGITALLDLLLPEVASRGAVAMRFGTVLSFSAAPVIILALRYQRRLRATLGKTTHER